LEQILKYFPNLTSGQIEKFGKMQEVYNEWNEKINVISRQDIGELYTRHVLHSLAIAKVIRFTEGTKIVDVGCGGGFPGIPLAVLFPDVHFTLVDSIGKKITVVNEVAKALELKNVAGIQERAEKLSPGTFDFVISRAVTAFPQFVAFTRKLVSPVQKNSMPNGILYLKGGDFGEEVKPFGKRVEIFNIPDFFDDPFFETKKVIFLSVD
jgi:16S rRNA (guanine527-N7)-methyltransferase